ncbi:Cyclin domain-containing protein [Aphelenchoides besseyi]|nr:Cyclin domain-containing protein [Aphelenchoides besseyi]
MFVESSDPSASEEFDRPRELSTEEREMLRRQQEMTQFKKNKLEIEAQKNWIKFYIDIGQEPNLENFFSDVNLTQNLVFLEAGAGVGNMLFPLTEYFNNWKFYAFDFASNAVEEIRKRAQESDVNVTAKVVDLTAPTTSDEQADFPLADLTTLIFVLSAIHPDKHSQAVRNLFAYVRPGGSVFVRDYGAMDYAMIRFGRGAKIADRFYARQDGTRAFYFYKEELCNTQMSPNNNESPSWLFMLHEIENTPSRKTAISEVDEDKKRRKSVTMIRQLCGEMKLNMKGTGATASVFFHRFYMFHSMSSYPTRIAVLGCLFLAGKVEETPKKCRDIIAVAQAKFPNVYASDTTQDVMNFEKVLLHTLRFDLQVEQPYDHLLDYLKIFHFENKDTKSAVATKAWTFINDSYSTTLCLMWDPEIIAIALLQMAITMSKEDHVLPQNLNYTNSQKYTNWWDHFVNGLTSDTLEIIKQILLKYYEIAQSEV